MKNRLNLTVEQKLNLRLKLLSFAFNLCVFLGLTICAIFNSKYIECIILLVSFLALRYAFPKTYHSQSFWVCMFWSIAIFFIALPNVLPIHLSIFFGVVIGCVVDFVLFKIEDYLFLQRFYKKHTEFNLDNPTKEQIVDICKALHYNQNKIQLAVMFFVDKLSNYEIWEYLQNKNQEITVETVTKYKYRMKKDIEKFTTK